MRPGTFVLLGLLAAAILLIAAEVAVSTDLPETSSAGEKAAVEVTTESNNGVNDAKYGGYPGGGYGGYPRGGGYGHGGHGGYPGRGGYGGYPGRGRGYGGGYCRYGCCEWGNYGRNCRRCCSYAGEAVDKVVVPQEVDKPHN
ncbi:glycine-rich protein 3 short isoform-like isoform X1 [Punica granatum]|uniref:Glycine-rich protein 3 short isoform-like isoform X1 n=2 Tax=Punica granatum TaxID=22663 RepID=A0A6P8CBR4_PUNGR|nr:glycine-rich protein 3 short isoform-like isoform X1 [Punica granatum]PKI32549.1 hypothetical protein CRG98_047047 [Punica granatum]